MDFKIYDNLEEVLQKAKKTDNIIFSCKKCGKEVSKQKRVIKTEEDLYCKQCKMKIKNIEKYGVDNVFKSKEFQKKAQKNRKRNGPKKGREKPKEEVERSKKTKKEKYGDENYNNIEKAKQTNLERYGVENVGQHFKDKIKQSHFQKYGKYYTQTKEFKESLRDKIKERFVENKLYSITNVIPLFEKYEGVKKEYKWKCNKCGNIFFSNLDKGKVPVCRVCYPLKKGSSLAEKEISEYIKSLGEEVNNNTYLIIPPYEVDIYIPQKKIAIEYNGLYWHNEQNLKKEPKRYHLNKTLMAKKNGIRLIHIFEDEWLHKRDIVKGRLRSILGKNNKTIGGREIDEIKEILSKEKNVFLNMYHIQGEDKSSISIGAFKENSLIAVMTFSKPRISMGKKVKNGEWELSRFVTIFDVKTPGVASKMFNYFIKKYNPIKIYSYSDIRWNTGRLYEAIGMEYKGRTEPNYWYIEYDRIRVHRFKYRKQRLKYLLENFDENLTEYENMLYHGYDRIWDCGSDKWEIYFT